MAQFEPQAAKPITSQFLTMKLVDPVCRANLAGGGGLGRPAVTFLYHGVHLFFCSESCKTLFEQNPQGYLKAS